MWPYYLTIMLATVSTSVMPGPQSTSLSYHNNFSRPVKDGGASYREKRHAEREQLLHQNQRH